MPLKKMREYAKYPYQVNKKISKYANIYKIKTL